MDNIECMIKHVDYYIEKNGECLVGWPQEQLYHMSKDEIADELRARSYVVRDASSIKGYVVYPKRKKVTGPWMVVEVVA